MPQSLARVYIHLVFSTKHRQPCIAEAIRPRLWEYLGGILRQSECPSVMIGGVSDHVHVLFLLSRTLSLASIVEEAKTASSKWIKTQDEALDSFHWQSGYGAFSVSESNVAAVTAYIANQEEHHKKMTFQDELRLLFRKHNVEFDERYVWD